MLISEKLNAAINEQVGHELANSHQYLAIASYFEAEGLFGLAKIYASQSDEERTHALKFIKFLNDAGAKVAVPAVPAPRNTFKSAEDAAQLALDTERVTTQQIYDLVTLANEEKNYIAFNAAPVVRQRTARRGFERRDASGGDQAGQAERPDGRGVPRPHRQGLRAAPSREGFPPGGRRSSVSEAPATGRLRPRGSLRSSASHPVPSTPDWLRPPDAGGRGVAGGSSCRGLGRSRPRSARRARS
ncbi:MAG: ferritin [Isosphaeraceae bacterium]